MKKAIRLAACMALSAAFVLPLAAFSSCSHEHVWAWERSDTEHWKVCTICGEETDRGEHDDETNCTICAEFKAVAFYTPTISDSAHKDFHEDANEWFAQKATEMHFIYDTQSDWGMMTDDYLANYDVVMFLDNKPGEEGLAALHRYVDNGGAWIGFHVCAFLMDDNLDPDSETYWYHYTFLGSGNFTTNTWHPTSERVYVETFDHYATKNVPESFVTPPNEWYGWECDLTENPDITVLAALDSSKEDNTFPIGTPTTRPNECWNEGYWPVVWANNNYNMLYFNMGHNWQSYNYSEKDPEVTAKTSSTFTCEEQNQMFLDGLFGAAELSKAARA